MRRITWSVYAFSAAMVVAILLVGLVIRENRAHQDELAQAVASREETLYAYLGELCERLQLRDDIQISYLQAASARYAEEDPDYSETLAQAAQALQISQAGCLEGIPTTEEGG